MNITPRKQSLPTKDDAFATFNDIYKNGGFDLPSFPTMLRFEYRDLTKMNAAKLFIEWADSKKIKHPYIEKLKAAIAQKEKPDGQS